MGSCDLPQLHDTIDVCGRTCTVVSTCYELDIEGNPVLAVNVADGDLRYTTYSGRDGSYSAPTEVSYGMSETMLNMYRERALASWPMPLTHRPV